MVYMGVKVTACNRIYDDGVKVGVVAGVPHLLTLQMDYDVPFM
jgi:hypothetical protein